jgi:hypothetical protein
MNFWFGLICMVIGAAIGACIASFVCLARVGREERNRDSEFAARLTAGLPLALTATPAVPVAEPGPVPAPPAAVASWWRRGLRGMWDRPWGETAEVQRLRLGERVETVTAVVLAAAAVPAEIVEPSVVEPQPAPAEPVEETVPEPGAALELEPELSTQPPLAPEPDAYFKDPITSEIMPNWARFSNIWPTVTPATAAPTTAADHRTGVAA